MDITVCAKKQITSPHSKFQNDKKKPSVQQLVIKSGVNLQILYALSLV